MGASAVAAPRTAEAARPPEAILDTHERLRAEGFGLVSAVCARSVIESRGLVGAWAAARGRSVAVAPAADAAAALAAHGWRAGDGRAAAGRGGIPALLFAGTGRAALDAARAVAMGRPEIPALLATTLDSALALLLDPETPTEAVTGLLQGLVAVGEPERRILDTVVTARRLAPLLRSPYEGLVYYMLEARPETRGRFTANRRIEAGGRGWEVDSVAEAERLVIEIDGRQHDGHGQRGRDARKERALAALGYTFRRFAADRVAADPVGVWRLVAERLAAAAAGAAGGAARTDGTGGGMTGRSDAVDEATATLLPGFDLARLARLDAADLILARLDGDGRGKSPAELRRTLGPEAGTPLVEGVLRRLRADGLVAETAPPAAARGRAGATPGAGRLALTAAGAAAARRLLGRDAGEGWDRAERRLAHRALGLDADDPATRRRLGGPAGHVALKSAIIAVLGGLPRDFALDPAAVRSELVWRALRAGLPALLGREALPRIDKPGTVDRILLASLAGPPGRPKADPLGAIAARALGARSGETGDLRRCLIERALFPPATGAGAGAGMAGETASGFVGRVLAVVREAARPPLHDRVPIAQVYDAYGRRFDDAGTLAAFKARLIEAGRRHELDLARLDLPELLDPGTRERSAAGEGVDVFHFVKTR